MNSKLGDCDILVWWNKQPQCCGSTGALARSASLSIPHPEKEVGQIPAQTGCLRQSSNKQTRDILKGHLK